MPAGKVATADLHVSGLHWASEKAVVEQVLARRPGVPAVAANPVSQTATVIFDTAQTSVAELRRWVEGCGYHCAGQYRSTCATRWRSLTQWTGATRCAPGTPAPGVRERTRRL